MKICIYNLTTGIKFGGIEVFTLCLAETLGRKGEDVYLFTGKGKMEISPASFKIRRFHYLPHHYIPDLGTRFRKFVSRLTFAIFSFKDLYKEKFDIIHIQKPYDMPVACLVKAITGAKIILGSHGTDFYFGDKLFVKGVDGIFSCSSFNAGEIWARYTRKARVIYNGCNLDIFKPMEPDKELKERFKLEGVSVIFTAARLVNWKRIDLLIRAIPLLKSKNFKVMICGHGEHKSNLLHLIKALRVKDKIIWTGGISHRNLPRYLSLADIYIQPSISEAFGISLCEAMGMAIPVIASRSGGTPEAIEDGINGILVEAGNIEKIAGAIDSLLADREMRCRMGKEGRKKVERMFTWDKVAERVMEGYKEVCVSL